MDNPDPTQFIAILAHKAALVDQQAAFDSVIAEKEAANVALAEARTAADALLEATKADAAAELAEATAAHSQAMAEAQKTISEAAPALQAAQAEIEALKAEVVRLTPPPVPPSIKAWQAKAVLALHGILASEIEVIIAAIDEPQRTVAISAWNNNADFSRQSPTILALAAQLQLTDEQLDAMFQQAAALSV